MHCQSYVQPTGCTNRIEILNFSKVLLYNGNIWRMIEPFERVIGGF